MRTEPPEMRKAGLGIASGVSTLWQTSDRPRVSYRSGSFQCLLAATISHSHNVLIPLPVALQEDP